MSRGLRMVNLTLQKIQQKEECTTAHILQLNSSNSTLNCNVEADGTVSLANDAFLSSSNSTLTCNVEADGSVILANDALLLSTNPSIETVQVCDNVTEIPIYLPDPEDSEGLVGFEESTCVDMVQFNSISHLSVNNNFEFDTNVQYAKSCPINKSNEVEITSDSELIKNPIILEVTEILGNSTGSPSNSEQTTSKKRAKRRQVNRDEWKAKRNAKQREAGKDYIGKKMIIDQWDYTIKKKKKEIKVRCNCLLSKKLTTLKCNTITDEERQEIFQYFWCLAWGEKKMYVKYNTVLSEKQRHRPRNESSGTSKRCNSIKYFLKVSSNSTSIRVCKKMFENTLNLSQGTILNWIKDGKKNKPDGVKTTLSTAAPKLPSKRAQQRKNLKYLHKFFTDLAKMESHYCRASTSKLYLEPCWHSKQELFAEYKLKWCVAQNITPVSLSSFSNTFEDMNLSLFRPKKDECDVCVGYKTKNIEESEYQIHVNKKNRARLEKHADKEKSNQRVFTMDLQSVLLSPKSNVSSLYYKTKLTVHNFTLFDLKTTDGYCFLWHEAEGGLGSNEFASIVSKFLLSEVIPNLEDEKAEIVLYSDGCTYQNRNCTLSNSLINIAVGKGVTIIQKYLEKGHTQMEADSMHSNIERKIKERTINVPADYVDICRIARTKPRPYNVQYIDHTFFKNFENMKFYSSIRPGKKSGDPTVTQIRALKYNPNWKIQYKLDFDDDWAELPQRMNKNLLDYIPLENIPQLYDSNLKIKKEKFDHLQLLKKSIPCDYHAFYDNLPH